MAFLSPTAVGGVPCGVCPRARAVRASASSPRTSALRARRVAAQPLRSKGACQPLSTPFAAREVVAFAPGTRGGLRLHCHAKAQPARPRPAVLRPRTRAHARRGRAVPSFPAPALSGALSQRLD